ncbi:MAG: hypothetical protein WA323_22240 [Candidatus Nitrosopolaris sp.]|jgi:hypothetical protein
MVFDAGQIKSPTVSALAKASMYTQVNQFLMIAQKNTELLEHDKRMRRLQAEKKGSR